MKFLSVSFYRLMTFVLYPFIAAYLAFRKSKGKEDLNRFPERMGIASKERPDGQLVWLHGASVGETLSMLPVIEKIKEIYPKTTVMVTSGSITSAQLMEKRLPENAFHQYIPIDCVPQIRRFINYWKPDAVFWFESEFWPNTLSVIAENKIPLILLNGRVSDKSFARWQKMPKFSKELQEMFTKSFGQTQEDERRLKEIGALNTACVGNIKFSSPALPVDDAELKKMQSQINNRPCWVVASTHSNEEEQIAKICNNIKKEIPNVLVVVAPRHPNRCDEVENIFKNEGFKVSRRSRKEDITDVTDVYLSDTMGEMGLVYRLGQIAFVGGSLIPFGGQNVIEPARLEKAVLSGVHTMNFREIISRLENANAIGIVKDASDLEKQVVELLQNDKLLADRQKNAFAFAEEEASVLDRLMPAIAPYFEQKKQES